MKGIVYGGAAAVIVGAVSVAPAMARDTTLHMPLKDVLAMAEAQGKLDGSVKFYLEGAEMPAVESRFGSDVSNKKTNSVGKSDSYACNWAALSALMAFQEKAKSIGANAVVGILSYYKKMEYKSATDFECHAGNIVVGVALKGTYAKVKD